MIAIVFIALAAGCASALMFASLISGALISLVLFYLAPLPLMVAAIAWGPLTAIIGGAAAAGGLGAIFGLPYLVAYAVMVALPAWWLGHLALLGRPAANGTSPGDGAAPATPDLEWYPVGRILLWISGFAALTTFGALLTLGTDAATINGALRDGLLHLVSEPGEAVSSETEQVIEAVIIVVPVAASIFAMPILTLNLWLAARIAATSGRLHRPWPDLKAVALPPMTLAALCVAIAFCFSTGLPAMLAEVVASALMMAYALTGFAVLHTVTQTLRSRAFWLGSTYALVVMFVWPVLAMVLLGLADAVFGVRQRYLRQRPPPLPAP
jgi:hypothetical protein